MTVNPSTTGTLTNTAVISGNETETNPSNNTAMCTNTVECRSTWQLPRSARRNQLRRWNQLTYTLTSTNHGPSNATGVTIVDTLPAGVTYVSTSGAGTATAAGNTITVALGNLAASATDSTQIVVTVNPSTTGTLTNTAVISGNEAETNSSNNIATCMNTVDVPVKPLDTYDLAVNKSGPATVTTGTTMTYTLVVHNYSTATETAILLTDTLPAGETFVSASGAAYTLPGSQEVVFNLGAMAAQAIDTVSIRCKSLRPPVRRLSTRPPFTAPRCPGSAGEQHVAGQDPGLRAAVGDVQQGVVRLQRILLMAHLHRSCVTSLPGLMTGGYRSRSGSMLLTRSIQPVCWGGRRRGSPAGWLASSGRAAASAAAAGSGTFCIRNRGQ